MKDITLSADEKLIEAVEARAHAEQTTVNDLFCKWLADYVHHQEAVQRYEKTMAELRGKVKTGGKKFTRGEMNER
ncbi:MAG TPA: hypothetical protein VFP95_03190 [Gammaproteobacteria bacterium]|nr:hypothetical protein [Gammaproteobacteria bacterium]